MRNCQVYRDFFGPFHKMNYCTRCHDVSEHPTDKSNKRLEIEDQEEPGKRLHFYKPEMIEL